MSRVASLAALGSNTMADAANASGPHDANSAEGNKQGNGQEAMGMGLRGHSSSTTPLPASVRGAPPELRREIRKRQNSESAKRCRERKKVETLRTADEMATQTSRIQALEMSVAALSARVSDVTAIAAELAARSGIPFPPPSAMSYPAQHTRGVLGCAAYPQASASIPYRQSVQGIVPSAGGIAFANAGAGPQPSQVISAAHAHSITPGPPGRHSPHSPQNHQLSAAHAAAVQAASAAHALQASQAAQSAAGNRQSPNGISTQTHGLTDNNGIGVQSHGLAEHTRQLQQVLAHGQNDDAAALATKIDELESNTWQ